MAKKNKEFPVSLREASSILEIRHKGNMLWLGLRSLRSKKTQAVFLRSVILSTGPEKAIQKELNKFAEKLEAVIRLSTEEFIGHFSATMAKNKIRFTEYDIVCIRDFVDTVANMLCNIDETTDSVNGYTWAGVAHK